MEATPAQLALLARLDQEMSKDWDLQRAVAACLEKKDQPRDPFFPWRVVVDWMSEITGEFEERVRAVRLVTRLVELGLLRPYRMMANQLEFTELMGILAKRLAIAAKESVPPPRAPTPRPPRCAPSSSKRRGQSAERKVGPDGLTECAEEALLDLCALANETGTLPTPLILRLYQVWQERGSPFLPSRVGGMHGVLQPLAIMGMIARKVVNGPYLLTEKGRVMAENIKRRRAKNAAAHHDQQQPGAATAPSGADSR